MSRFGRRRKRRGELDVFGRCPVCGTNWDAGDGTSLLLAGGDDDGAWEYECPGCQTVFPRYE